MREFKIRSLKHLQQLIRYLPLMDAQIDDLAGIRLSKTGPGTATLLTATESPYTLIDPDFLVELYTGAGDISVTIEKPKRPRWLIFKKTHGSNTATINSAENIDGVPARFLTKINEYLVIYWDGTTWLIAASGQEQAPTGPAGGVLSGSYPIPYHVGGGTLPPTPLSINVNDIVPGGYSAVAVDHFDIGAGVTLEIGPDAFFAII